MNLFGILEISSSAMKAERARAEVVAANLANAETTRTPEGGPYRRQHVSFRARRVGSRAFQRLLPSPEDVHARGVRVERVVADSAPPVRRFDPAHPDADIQGYVSYPAINPVEEMVDLMGAARAYQLNVAAAQATKSMIVQSLELLR
jgi:flagellar basal-body rod protein FlgC